MKTKKSFILIAAVCLLIAGGQANAQLQSEQRKVSEFTGLAVAVAGEVYLVQGARQEVVVEGTERVLSDLITEVRGGKLTIRMPSRWNFRRYDELKIYITMTEIDEISLSGSARLMAESPVAVENIKISISGSGRVEIDEFAASDLTASISGSGRLNLGGSRNLENCKIVISGSGRYDAMDLPAERVDARISGSGSCRVHALSGLIVRISGSGNVMYTGNPLIDARITGSGKIINNN